VSEPVPLDAHPPWDTALEGTQAELPARADVVVVGASVAGTAAAVNLQFAGTDVVVLDADSPTGDGADRRGPMQAFHAVVEQPWRLEQSLGAAQSRALFALGGRGVRSLDQVQDELGIPTGLLWAATEPDREPAEIIRSARVLSDLDIQAEVWSAEEVRERTGMQHLERGLWIQRELRVDVMDLLQTLLHGKRTVRDAAIAQVDEHGEGVTVTLKDGRTLEAEVVILANGFDARALHPFLADTLDPVREVAIRRPGPPGPEASLRAGFGWTTLSRDAAGAVTVSGCRWASPHLETGEIDPMHAHPAVLERVVATGDRFASGLGPPTARWGWIEAHGCDNLPLVGPLPSSRRILLCTGFGANPIGLGLACGGELAEGLLEGTAPGIPACLDPARFVG